jgi:aryl-alcohol dehydrogenase-like predicted oxidoreductase
VISGSASPEGTQAFAHRCDAAARNGFYHEAQGLTFSSLGIGTYLGKPDLNTTERYTESVSAAVRGGINLIDTSLNYRRQHSERAIGAALGELQPEFRRDALIICTKAGYLVPDAVPAWLDPQSIAGGMHSLDPDFLSDQLERSRANLGVETIDIYYLHNPESQLEFVPVAAWENRLRRAFERMERFAESGLIQYWGIATWNALRQTSGGVSLARLVSIAEEVIGSSHHLRFVQLPYNLAMTEAYTLRNQEVAGERTSLLDAAARLGINVIGSASLLQSKLTAELPEAIAEAFVPAASDAERAIQFARSAPGLTSALVGMSTPAHVEQNLAVAGYPPLDTERYLEFFGVAW